MIATIALLVQTAAVAVDGRLDPSYGAPQSTQIVGTAQKNTPGFGGTLSTSESFGSELDAGYGFVQDDTLHLFFSGNLMCYTGELPHEHQLHVFLDTRAGGQNTLRSDNADVGVCGNGKLDTMAGLTFDRDFSPDWWYACGVYDSLMPVRACSAELRDGGNGPGYFLGQGQAGGPGTLSGGTNPFGVLVSIDNSNSAGVAQGCQATSDGGVTSGIEWAIPLAAIGAPTGSIRVCAIIGGCFFNTYLSNQVLAPLPAGICALGNPATVDLDTIPGAQWFTVLPAAGTPTPGSVSLELSSPWPNPAHGAARFTIGLPSAAWVAVTVRDVAGRTVAKVFEGRLAPGAHAFAWPTGAAISPGVYTLELRADAQQRTRTLVVLGSH